MKTCSKCKVEKELDAFCNNKQSKDGKHYHCRECKAKFRKENKEKIAERKKLYSASQGGRINRHKSRSKRIKSVQDTGDGSITRQSLDDLMAEQGNKCAICNTDLLVLERKEVHMEHIIPLAKGGKHVIGNVQWTCCKCNLIKSTKIIE